MGVHPARRANAQVSVIDFAGVTFKRASGACGINYIPSVPFFVCAIAGEHCKGSMFGLDDARDEQSGVGQEARPVEVTVTGVNGEDLISSIVFSGSTKVLKVSRPWLRLLGEEGQDVSLSKTLSEVAGGAGRLQLTGINIDGFDLNLIGACWTMAEYMESALEHIDEHEDARYIGRAIEFVIARRFVSDGPLIIDCLKCLLKQRGHLEWLTPLRPFLQDLRRCLNCREVNSDHQYECQLGDYNLVYTTRDIQNWKNAVLTGVLKKLL